MKIIGVGIDIVESFRVEKSLKNYKMNDAIKLIYNFVLADFCDWYIEFSKSRIYGQSKEDKKVVLSISTYILKSIFWEKVGFQVL